MRAASASRTFRRALIEDRRAAVQKGQQRSRCAACGNIGHWAGDAIRAKSSKSGPKKVDSKKKGSGKGKSKGKAYLVGESPSYFSVAFTEGEDEQVDFCNMVGEIKAEEEDPDPMLEADLDARRKKARLQAEESEQRVMGPGQPAYVATAGYEAHSHQARGHHQDCPEG